MASLDYRTVKRAPSRRMTAWDLMTRDSICLTEQTPLADCTRLTRERGVSALPVTSYAALRRGSPLTIRPISRSVMARS